MKKSFGIILLVLVLLLACGVGALTFFIAKTTEPNWSVLYSDLQQQDVMAITESLKKNIKSVQTMMVSMLLLILMAVVKWEKTMLIQKLHYKIW